MNPFSALTSKIFAGLSAFLLVALAVQSWRLDNAKERIEDLVAENALLTLAVERQNQAVRSWEEAAQAAQQRSRSALVAVRREAPRVEQRARRLEAPRPLSGECRTPQEVREAGL